MSDKYEIKVDEILSSEDAREEIKKLLSKQDELCYYLGSFASRLYLPNGIKKKIISLTGRKIN